MSVTDPSVWVIVVTYNGSKWIQACLESISSSTLKPKIMVVDNNSSDGTAQLITDLFPEVDLITSKRNLGFGLANNIGIKEALHNNADYICLVNQDAKLDTSAIAQMVDIAQQHQDYGILSPIHLNYNGNEIDPYFVSYISSGAPEFLSDILFDRVRDIYEVPFTPAALWLIKSAALREVGGFDPLFFMYGEDFDLCQRMHRFGWKIGLVPCAVGYHWHGGPPKTNQSIQHRSRDLYWQMIVMLKNKDHSLARLLLEMFRQYVVQILKLVVYLDYREIAAVGFAWLKVLPRLKQISSHRRLCKEGQGIFLSE